MVRIDKRSQLFTTSITGCINSCAHGKRYRSKVRARYSTEPSVKITAKKGSTTFWVIETISTNSFKKFWQDILIQNRLNVWWVRRRNVHINQQCRVIHRDGTIITAKQLTTITFKNLKKLVLTHYWSSYRWMKEDGHTTSLAMQSIIRKKLKTSVHWRVPIKIDAPRLLQT